jgi:hypothetical protein
MQIIAQAQSGKLPVKAAIFCQRPDIDRDDRCPFDCAAFPED